VVRRSAADRRLGSPRHGGRREEAHVLMTAPSRQRPSLLTALTAMLIAVAATLVVSAGAPATAQPGDSGADDEGGSKSLRQVLDAANRGFLEAKAKLDTSKKRQLELSLELKDLQARHAALSAEVGHVAAQAYRNGRLTTASMLLESDSADSFWQRATAADTLARLDAKQLSRITESRERIAAARLRLQAEIREQTKQLAVMAKRKQDAQRALFASGGGQPTSNWASGSAPLADRFTGGSGGCTIDDPTTSGCITPRTLHAYQQARSAGFKRHTSCKRSGGSGEHPLGRACDFSAATNGFENVNATGGDRVYGDRLALFLVKNADRLGVMYVIWYGKIWMPSNGLTTYSGCCNPAATHKNHVHLSVL
jgi:hypothetical protein